MAKGSPFQRARIAYEQKVRRLARFLPEYNQLLEESECPVQIEFIDYYNDGEVQAQGPSTWDADSSHDTLADWLGRRHEAVTTRYILVEDVAPSICLTLGAVLDLDPRFFVNHINNSSSLMDNEKHRMSPNWKSSTRLTPYISFSWCRPVARNGAMVVEKRRAIEARSVTKEVTRPGAKFTLVHSGANVLRPELVNFSVKSSNLSSRVRLAAIEERASIFKIRVDDNCNYVIMLLDKVPQQAHTRWSVPWDDSEELPRLAPVNATTQSSPLYKCLVPRMPPDIIADVDALRLEDLALNFIYTNLASSQSCMDAFFGLNSTPLHILAGIVESDTLGLLRLVSDIQSDVLEVTLSPDAELDDILALRTLVARLQSQIPDLSLDVQEALKSLTRCSEQEYHGDTHVHRIGSTFDKANERLDKTLHTISGTLQFIESHRAILETESISRLTELAFLFIPLSFVASLFSMQIQSLSNPVPVSHFVACALSLSVTTYGIRAFARSTWVHKRKLSVLKSIRTHYPIPAAASISNRVVLLWFLVQIKSLPKRAFAQVGYVGSLSILLLVVFVPPVVVLWKRELTIGLSRRAFIRLDFLFLFFSIFSLVLIIVAPCRS
ncbi:uncharacterized protein BDV14DRAFT_209992 [Aspergillus stella-maris]|uniref:uncharacterized protein n=1 Tax=Aspergillus stella-maris TaxID=1810926 RepID=UPI003CCCF446